MIAPPSSPPASSRPKPPPIPDPLVQAIDQLAASLKASHGSFFKRAPRLKYRLARLLASRLPPLSRRGPGRPPFVAVSKAIRLRAKLRRSEPDARRMWTMICIAVIPNYESLKKPEQKEARAWLRERVKWRLRARARRKLPHHG